jgi:hypothetical protein
MAREKAAPKRDPKPARPLTLSASWAAVILALLTVLFFHEVALEGKTFVSPDTTAPAGFVRIGEQTLWKDHVYPLWNPFVFLGMPSFGSGAYNPLIYPPDWPLGLVQKVVPLPEMTWMILYYFLGGFFFFLLAREWGARAEGALLGAVAFAFVPNLVAVGSHGHGSQLVDSAYLPLMVWLASRWLRRGSLTDLGWLALAGGFQFLRGHLQICVYTWMAVGSLAVIEVLAALREPSQLLPRLLRAAGVAAAAALAFGIAGFYNLPLRDYSQYSIRGTGDAAGGVGVPYATAWSMAPYELGALVVPNWVGFGGATYWGAMPFTDYPNAYVGIVAMLLAALAFARPGSAAKVWAVLLGVFALLVSFGSHFPLYGFLYDHLPQFNKFRVPVMVILLFHFSVALGLAWGWTNVLEAGDAKRRDLLGKLVLALGVVLALAMLAAGPGQEMIRGPYVAAALARKQPFSPQQAQAAFDAFAGDLGRVAFTGLAVAAVTWLALRGRLKAAFASVLVLLVLVFDLWPVGNRLMQPVIGSPTARSLDYGRDDVVEFLEKAGPWGSFRVFVPQQFQDNRLAGFGIATLGGAHAAKPRLFQDLMDSQALDDPNWWRLLNVRFIVLDQPLDPAQTPPWLHVVHQGSAVIYENLAVLPRATVVGAWGVVPDSGRAAIEAIGAGGRDVAKWTWLTKAPAIAPGPVEGATAAITKYTLHDVDVDVETPAAGILRLADMWYPDWTVKVDGKPAEMLRADHALRAVAVPAGRHRVEFRYASPSVRQGLLLSIACAVVALALLAGGWLLGRRRAPAAAEGGG